MKFIRTIWLILLLNVAHSAIAQQPAASWEKWNHLIGEWIGEGSGQPGQSEGTFSFQTDLDGKILVRKNHTVFPATASSSAKIHDDLLIVYQVDQEGLQEAIYFDNEGNTINYKVSFKDNAVVLTSDITANRPRFRLSYVSIDSKTVNISFEMASSQAPEEFRIYLSGKALKVK
jgi:hypothetical protein